MRLDLIIYASRPNQRVVDVMHGRNVTQTMQGNEVYRRFPHTSPNA